MSIPTQFNTTFRYLRSAAITDVATIITDFRSETVTNGGWTEPSGGLFKSPVDASGRFFDVLLTKIDATHLEWRVRDQSAVTICTRHIMIDASNDVEYFTGPNHAIVQSLRAGTAELAQAGMLDQSPEAQGSSSVYVYGNGYRTTGDVQDGQGNTIGQLFMLDNGAAGSANRTKAFATDLSGANVALFTGTATPIYSVVEVRTSPAATTRWGGFLFQHVYCDSGQAFGSDLVVPIDDGVTATFRVLSLATSAFLRIAVRKA